MGAWLDAKWWKQMIFMKMEGGGGGWLGPLSILIHHITIVQSCYSLDVIYWTNIPQRILLFPCIFSIILSIKEKDQLDYFKHLIRTKTQNHVILNILVHVFLKNLDSSTLPVEEKDQVNFVWVISRKLPYKIL